MTVSVRTSLSLVEHLRTFEYDGTTVASALFEGGRLSYPGRRDIEHQLGYVEPYTLELEARFISGLSRRSVAAVRLLARMATETHSGHDGTLDLLWHVHDAYRHPIDRPEGPALDRLVAALVTIEDLVQARRQADDGWSLPTADYAAEALVAELHVLGFPPTLHGLEELFDGAEPACCGLGIIEL